MLIDIFINAIFLYDDKMVITFNYKEGATTITFDDLKTALADQKTGSDLDCSTTPKRKTRRKSCLSFWVPLPLVASPFGIKMLGVGKAAPAQFFGPGDLRIYGA